jgi:hypothetical protein
VRRVGFTELCVFLVFCCYLLIYLFMYSRGKMSAVVRLLTDSMEQSPS